MGLEIGGITYGLQERDNTNDKRDRKWQDNKDTL